MHIQVQVQIFKVHFWMEYDSFLKYKTYSFKKSTSLQTSNISLQGAKLQITKKVTSLRRVDFWSMLTIDKTIDQKSN